MRNKINIDNYEVFYLDYLEGNLDQETSLDLFAFLAKHPDLQVEDLGPTLADFDLQLGDDFKTNLKQDLGFEKINVATIEYFLTAEKEGQLSDSKISELDAFLKTHPAFAIDRKLYALTTLQAEKSLVFEPKKSLKHSDTIVLWPYLTALVAASAALLIWLWPSPEFNGSVQSAAGIPAVKSPQNALPSPNVNSLAHADFPKNIDSKKQTEWAKASLHPTSPSASKDLTANLKIRKAADLSYDSENNIAFITLDERTPTSIAYQASATIKEENSSALTMNEALKPVTSRLSDVIKTQVDYQTGVNATSQRKGFHLKIGQFEMYQNKSVKSQR
ncbi:MAG: hypothetical protein WC044_00395 [Crocinitomicaceae bacterium]